MSERGEIRPGWRWHVVVLLLSVVCSLRGALALGNDAEGGCSADHPPHPPSRDLPSQADRARLHGCNAASFYYGLDTPVNFKDARLCAFIEIEEERAGFPMQGAGMLMVIYFNGDGAARSRTLAKQFACQLRGYQNADTLLDALDAAATAGKRFDACDAADDANSFNVCDILSEDIRRHAAKDAERKLISGWGAARRDAFPALKEAEEAYTKARALVDIVNPRSYSDFQYEANFENEFVAMLKALDGRDDLPSADLAERDRELNSAYRRVLKALSPDDENDTSPEAALPRARLREAERRWLDYVAACEAFRVATQSTLSADALRRLLVVQRTQALRGILAAHGDEQ